MSNDFDPYHRWLGIPPSEQPPNHYRLLGIQLYEDDADVIAEAADQRMSHLRTHQSGKHSKLSQKLLNEVSAARICLLKPERKKSYDEALRDESSKPAEASNPSEETQASTSESGPEVPKIATKSQGYAQQYRQRATPLRLPLILAAAALVVVVLTVATIAIVLSPKVSEPANGDGQREVAEKEENPNENDDPASQQANDKASQSTESKLPSSATVEQERLTEPERGTPNASESDSSPTSDMQNVETSSPEKPSETTADPMDAAPVDKMEPETLIVGTAPNQLPNLDIALQKAKPGDTIEIHHRGPLEFNPVNLTAKTPLKIMGGKTGEDVDFRPLIRVRAASSAEQPERAIFYGDDLQLHVKKIHLAAGGQAASFFELKSGRIEIEDCTLTVGSVAPYWEAPSSPMALLKTRQSSGQIELVVKRSLLRGSRLESCAVLDGSTNVHISVNQTVWAGGRAPWIAATGIQNLLELNLQSCTLCNLVNALRWENSRTQSQDHPSVNAVVDNVIFVGAKSSQEPLIVWNPKDSEDDVSKATEEGRFVWKGENNVYHLFPTFFRKRNTGQSQDVTDWTRYLLKQSGSGAARVADPFFYVQPDGIELDHVQANDLSPRFLQDRILVQRLREQPIGADDSQVPHGPILALRESATTTSSGAPRTPRILQINQKSGPLRTLEEAFREARDGDVIEFTDSETYTPTRDFLAEPARGILVSPVNNLTVRAAKNTDPVIFLRDDVHKGRLPDSELFLFHMPKGNLVLDGLHFRIGTSVSTPRAITLCEDAKFFRVTNCTVVELVPGCGIPGPPGTDFSSSETLAFHFGPNTDSCLKWLENSVFISQGGPGYFLGGNPTGEDGHLLFLRNCLFRGNSSYWAERPRFVLRMESNSIFGRVASLHHSCSLFSTSCEDNLVVSKGSIFGLHPYVIGRGEKRGARNAVWEGTRPSSANKRSEGALGFIPGPILPYPPQPSGRSTASSPYRSFELKEKQPAATMAHDGGPVGIRAQYLPKLPGLPRTFFQ